MPNWCDTDLVFKGPAKSLDALVEQINTTRYMKSYVDHRAQVNEWEVVSLLNAFLPRPADFKRVEDMTTWSPAQIDAATSAEVKEQMLKDNEACWRARAELVEQIGTDDWYSWSVRNWGTKWPDESEAPLRRPRSVTMRLMTAWSSPVCGLITISQMTGLSISGRWYEAGMGVRGKYVIKAGELVEDQGWDYHGYRGG